MARLWYRRALTRAVELDAGHAPSYLFLGFACARDSEPARFICSAMPHAAGRSTSGAAGGLMLLRVCGSFPATMAGRVSARQDHSCACGAGHGRHPPVRPLSARGCSSRWPGDSGMPAPALCGCSMCRALPRVFRRERSRCRSSTCTALLSLPFLLQPAPDQVPPPTLLLQQAVDAAPLQAIERRAGVVRQSEPQAGPPPLHSVVGTLRLANHAVKA